jgi:hypothetical protein
MELTAIIAALNAYKASTPGANKAAMEEFFQTRTGASWDRSVARAQSYAMRFSEAKGEGFSNAVASLSRLQTYDAVPFVVCIVRPDRLDFRLANTTFLKKISHSSQALREDNIRGTFLGHDVMADYQGLANEPRNFDALFALHQKASWTGNLSRLVAASAAIVGRPQPLELNAMARALLMAAPARAAAALQAPAYRAAARRLESVVLHNRELLLQTAALDNVNLRGTAIEQIFTDGQNAHRLDDLSFPLEGGVLIVDVKTKLMQRASAPKLYNIHKMLTALSRPGSVFSIFFIGLGIARHECVCRLVSIFDPAILKATRVQAHWAGRGSLGVTQLSGDLSPLFQPGFTPSVDIAAGQALIAKFLERQA